MILNLKAADEPVC